MPYTQVYEDITRRCDDCGQTLVATEIEVGSFLRSVLYCRRCNERWTLDYLFSEGRYVRKQSSAREATWSIHWTCEHGCDYACHATRIEVSTRFLRISFRCNGCQGTTARYYDLERHGFADVTGRISRFEFPRYNKRSRNRHRHVGVKECEHMEQCPLTEVHGLSLLVKLTGSDRIGGVVATVVENCPGMNSREISGCFGRLFGTPPDDRSERQETVDRRDALRDSFRRAYERVTDKDS